MDPQEQIPGSEDYKVTVRCSHPDYVIMNEDATVATCNTSTGSWNTRNLTPCCRTIDPN